MSARQAELVLTSLLTLLANDDFKPSYVQHAADMRNRIAGAESHWLSSSQNTICTF